MPLLQALPACAVPQEWATQQYLLSAPGQGSREAFLHRQSQVSKAGAGLLAPARHGNNSRPLHVPDCPHGVWGSGKKQGVRGPRATQALRSGHLAKERLCACLALAVFFSFPRQSSGIFWILPFLPCPGRGGGGHHACRLHPCPCAVASWGVEWRAVRPGRVDVPAGLRAMAGRRTSSQPLFPRQPQLLTEPLSPGRPSPHCRHPAGGWGRRSGLSQPSRAEKPLPRPVCGVIKLLAGLCPLPFGAQSTALVPVTTKGPYSPPSFISAGFGLTGSGCGDFYRNRAALPLTLRAQ